MLLGDLAQYGGLALAGTREQDVDFALFALDRIEQVVEVVEIRCVAAHAGHVPANQLRGLIERLLPAARDENVGAFFHEPFGARERQTARSTRDDCNLTLKLSHNLLLCVSCNIRYTAVDSSCGGRELLRGPKVLSVHPEKET